MECCRLPDFMHSHVLFWGSLSRPSEQFSASSHFLGQQQLGPWGCEGHVFTEVSLTEGVSMVFMLKLYCLDLRVLLTLRNCSSCSFPLQKSGKLKCHRTTNCFSCFPLLLFVGQSTCTCCLVSKQIQPQWPCSPYASQVAWKWADLFFLLKLFNQHKQFAFLKSIREQLPNAKDEVKLKWIHPWLVIGVYGILPRYPNVEYFQEQSCDFLLRPVKCLCCENQRLDSAHTARAQMPFAREQFSE